jgi:hypothetical protein
MTLATSMFPLAMRVEELDQETRQQSGEVQVLSIEPTKREHSDARCPSPFPSILIEE